MATFTIATEANGFSIDQDGVKHTFTVGALETKCELSSDVVDIIESITGFSRFEINVTSDTINVDGTTSFANAEALQNSIQGVIAAIPSSEGVQGTAVDKFGFNKDVDTGSYEVISAFGGTFGKASVMLTEQTYTITYDQTVDGSGTTGSLILQVTHVKEVDGVLVEQDEFHTLGSTGSDVSSFSGLGINRAVVVSFGGDPSNNADITFTATTDTTIQARVALGTSVTEQLIYHTPQGFNFDISRLYLTFRKLSGGGGSPELNFRLMSFSRVTLGEYNFREYEVDSAVSNSIAPPTFRALIGGREVVWVDCLTSTNNTSVSGTLGGTLTAA